MDYIFNLKKGKKSTVALGLHWCITFELCSHYLYLGGIIGINLFKFSGYLVKVQKDFPNITFDQVYSHVVSHEHIHNAICMIESHKTSVLFDNLFGEMPLNPIYIYSGIKFNGRMSFWQTIKKHLYSIGNKILVIKHAMHKLYKKFQLCFQIKSRG